MKKNLILTGWGRSEYAAAAAVALRAVGEADVIGVSMRRLVAVLERESVGRSFIYVLGVGLGDDEEAFATAASKIAAQGVAIAYLSMFEMDGTVRRLLETVGVKLCVLPKARVLGVSPNTVKKHLGWARIIRAKCRSSDSDERSLKSDG